MSEMTEEEYADYKVEVRIKRDHIRAVVHPMYKKDPINNIFCKTDKRFIDACDCAGIKPTIRQASKFRNKKGLAYSLYK